MESQVGRSTPIEYSIWGPTCDGIDLITESISLNGLLDVGNWLYFENMGAYTRCSATRFNGFTDSHEIIYISTEPSAVALLEYWTIQWMRRCIPNVTNWPLFVPWIFILTFFGPASYNKGILLWHGLFFPFTICAVDIVIRPRSLPFIYTDERQCPPSLL